MFCIKKKSVRKKSIEESTNVKEYINQNTTSQPKTVMLLLIQFWKQSAIHFQEKNDNLLVSSI